MNSLAKNVLYGSIGVAGLVAAGAVLDLVTGGGIFATHSTAGYVMDALFIVGAGIVIYLALDALAEQK
jgi:threonine/homoserine/homoserine lactone efflux protein